MEQAGIRDLLGVNRILGMGKKQYDPIQCKSASPDGVFTGPKA
jgi:hypothetical protein